MATAAIVIDDWKFSIFERRLNQGGFKFTRHAGIVAGTLTLKVNFDEVSFHALQAIVKAANDEAAMQALIDKGKPK